jgi:hypothetical protein
LDPESLIAFTAILRTNMAHAVKLDNEEAKAPPSWADGGVPAVAVVWRNGKDKPRGAWFPTADLDAAIAGAAEMGMHVIKAETPEIISLAQRLPKGRVFDSGKLFAPLIQTKVYEQLMAHLPEHGIAAKPRLVMSDKASGEASAQSASEAVQEESRPTDFSNIIKGSLVLAEDKPMEGWFEAIVLEVRDRDMFRLQWRDYPDELLITRHRTRLALMMQLDAAAAA